MLHTGEPCALTAFEFSVVSRNTVPGIRPSGLVTLYTLAPVSLRRFVFLPGLGFPALFRAFFPTLIGLAMDIAIAIRKHVVVTPFSCVGFGTIAG